METTAGWRLLGRCAESEHFEIEGVNVWAYPWRTLPGRAIVDDPIYRTRVTLTIRWIPTGQVLVRFAADEVSANVYAFAEYVGQCKRCLDLRGNFEIRTPGEFAKALRIAKQNVADATLVEVVDRGHPLTSIPDERPWPDVVELQFMCNMCGAGFALECETFHGAGGRWRCFSPNAA